MKKIALISSLTASVLLVGCLGSTGGTKPQAKAETVPDCVWPGTSQAAPGWTCDEPVEGVAIYAVGTYEKTAAGLQFQKDQAAAAARVTMAQQMKVYVSNMVKQYVETTGSSSSETVDKVNTSVSKLVTSETIEGSRIYKSLVSPNGTMYVMVGIDPKLANQKAEQVIKTSMNNDRALWQQFKASKSQDELAAAIVAGSPSKQ